MSEMIVYSYGMAEFTKVVFNAVVATVNDQSFDTILKGMFLVSVFAATSQYIATKNVAIIAKNLLLYTFVTTVLILPKATVVIKNNISLEDYTVGNVPIGLALPAHLVTNFFYGLTRLVETSFHQVDDASYSKTGFLYASHIVRNSNQVKITNPEIKQSLNSYLEQCVFYDIYLGAYTIEQLLRTDNIWGLISSNASANRSFLLDKEVVICEKGVKALHDQIKISADSAIENYAKAIFPTIDIERKKEENQIIKGKLINSVGSSYKYLTGLSTDGADILMQNIMINAVQDAALNNPELGMYSYAQARANMQKTVANNTTGLMMARWLPAMMTATEIMLYAFFILIVIFALFTNGEKVFFNYVMTMVWIGACPVVYAVFNFGFTWAIRMKSYGHGLSFYDSSALNQAQYDMASMFGLFTSLVPYITWGLMNLAKQGLGGVFTQMSQLVGSSTQSLAMASSGEAVTGNYNMGNTSFNNHSMYNTSGFKHDTNTGYASGAMTTTLPSGSQVTQTAGGNSVVNMDHGISRLNTSINIADRQSIAANEQLDKSIGASITDQNVLNNNMTSAARSLLDIGDNINKGTTVGESFNKNTSGGYAEAASEYAVAVERFAHENNMSKQDAAKTLIGAYANLSGTLSWNSKDTIGGWVGSKATGLNFNAQGTVGGKGDLDRSWTEQDAENFSKAQEFLKNNNLTKTFDKAIKGIEEHSYRSDMREGINLTDSMSVSFDKASQASQSYSAHLQEAQSYREMASYSKEHASNINYNAGQEFLEYVARQPMRSGEGAMGANQAEALLRTDSVSSNRYAEKFIANKIQTNLSSWKAEHLNKDDITSKGNDFKNSVSQMKDTELEYNINKNNLSSSNMAKNIKHERVNDTVKNDVQNLIRDSQAHMDSAKNTINTFGDARKAEASLVVKDKVEIVSPKNLIKSITESSSMIKDKGK